jgi:hypothetical protein
MEVDALLCNHAEVADGKLYVNGAGINMAFVGPQPPQMISVAVGLVVQVPYTATNQMHTVSLRLIDQDGSPVHPWVPPGVEPGGPVALNLPFNLGRPPHLQPGETQSHPMSVGFQLPVPGLGLFLFMIEVDGTEVRRLPLRVMVPPMAPGTMTPTSIPGLS